MLVNKGVTRQIDCELIHKDVKLGKIELSTSYPHCEIISQTF